MRQISLLLFLLPFINTARSAGRQPSCPNDQHPKLDKFGHPIQCLPGSSSKAVCGTNHMCFFSGVNYICCPSNEPSADNQPSCPPPTLTVLNSHGMPIKCNPRSRSCPKETMTCYDVGNMYICCERMKEAAQVNNARTPVIKRAPRKKNLRTTIAYEEIIDCPQNSIGLMKSDGTRVFCSTATDCPGTDTFCHGTLKRSICCKSYNFAANVLNLTDSVDSSDTVDSSAKLQKAFKTSSPSVRKGIEGVARVESTLKGNGKEATHPLFTSTSPTQLQKSEKIGVVMLARANNSSSSSSPSLSITTVANSEKAPLTPRPVAFAFLTLSDKKAEQQLIGLPSAMLPSQLFSKQDKRSMAQQFLMHQIRNGWPYADRFYRPDLDTFSPEQRRDMARIHFFDN